MSAVTLSSSKGYSAGFAEKTVSQKVVPQIVPRQGFFARLYAAIVATQMERAEREVAIYMNRTGKHLNW